MTATIPQTAVDDRLDLLTEQMAWLVADAQARRDERRRWSELGHDLLPVGSQALAGVSEVLDEMEFDLAAVTRLGKALVAALPAIEAAIPYVTRTAELSGALSELSGPAFEAATARLVEAESRGYFTFAQGAAGVVDRVVTSFTEEDVEALGQNIVLILNTVKEMTQPEVMGMLRRTIHNVQPHDEPEEPPSVLALLREMRDPGVRRGLGRMLGVLRTMGEDQ